MTPEDGPLERIVMGHEGLRVRDGQQYAGFTGKDSDGGKHRYLMPQAAWLLSERPTIITVTITEGVA